MSKLGRHGRLLVTLAALTAAVAAPALAADPVPPPTTVGGGTITGIAKCGSSLAVTAKATGALYNTVIKGYVGDLAIKGSGPAPCTSSTPVTLRVTGVGPTDSRMGCGKLVGTYANDATGVHINAVGKCLVNDYPIRTHWQIDAAPGFSGGFVVQSV